MLHRLRHVVFVLCGRRCDLVLTLEFLRRLAASLRAIRCINKQLSFVQIPTGQCSPRAGCGLGRSLLPRVNLVDIVEQYLT